MAENSGIEWTHHTYNPWIGCTRVSPACDHCYAEAWDRRGMQQKESRWGPHATRTRTKTRPNLRKWDQKAAELGVRYRVFCASLADIGDNHRSIEASWRRDLVADIRAFQNLDFLLLSKRPQNMPKLYPDLMEDWPVNAWMGASTENREEMLRRGDALAALPAHITFWSAEPLVGDLGPIPLDIMPSWVITGGESGAQYRHADPDWFRSLRDQCTAAGVPFLFKQWEGRDQKQIKAKGRELDGVIHDGYPQPLAA
jgi:protein gp37